MRLSHLEPFQSSHGLSSCYSGQYTGLFDVDRLDAEKIVSNAMAYSDVETSKLSIYPLKRNLDLSIWGFVLGYGISWMEQWNESSGAELLLPGTMHDAWISGNVTKLEPLPQTAIKRWPMSPSYFVSDPGLRAQLECALQGEAQNRNLAGFFLFAIYFRVYTTMYVSFPAKYGVEQVKMLQLSTTMKEVVSCETAVLP